MAETALLISAITGATAAVGGTALSIVEGNKAEKQQKKAFREQEKARQEQLLIDKEQRRRATVDQIRQARLARSGIEVGAAAGGLTQSSGFSGGVGGVGSIIGSSVGFTEFTGQKSDSANLFLTNAANYSQKANTSASKANLFGSVAQLGMSAFSASGGFDAFSST